MSQTGPDEYPDGSVGRYVRERWAQNARRSRRQASDAPDEDRRAQSGQDRGRTQEQAQGGAHAQYPGLGARRDETWGVVPDDAGWGSDLLESELDDVDPYPAPGGDEGRRTVSERHPGRPPEPRRAEPPAQRTAPPRAAPPHSAPPHSAPPHSAPPNGAAPHGPSPNGAPAQDRATNGTPAPGRVPQGTAPSGADPHDATPTGTDPHGTDPHGTDPHGTDPHGTAPHGTDPNGAGPDFAAPNGAPSDHAAPNGHAPHEVGPTGAHRAAEAPAAETGDRQAEPADPPPAPPQWRTAAQRPPRERRVVAEEGRTPPRGVPLGPPTGPNRPIRDVGRWTDPGAVAAREAQQARADSDADLADLSTARLLKPSRRRPPRTGWRRLLYLLTGRLINPGESPQDIRERELTTRVNQALLGCHKIATLSLKGGVGKTTITATLGATFASLRGDRVVAVDANPDRGTLSQKIPLETSATVRHLLRDAQRVRRYSDVRAYTSQGPSRLEVLASEQDPAVSEAFSEDDYRRTVTLLEHFYNIVLTDCGTGLMHSAMYGVLGVADQLIIVSSGSIDGARSASATMDWLEAHDHGDLVRNAVAVINNVHRQAGAVDLERVAQHFAGRCRAVVQIPFDPHLEEGAEVDLDRLSPPTRTALLELAASVADGFPS
ncbi:AAA family ATPase [Pseudonocardia sp. RS010]|uniref:nucleotide-binding protein n=1 Tax=Pseudonocardia sp. RS010 TaxID=3385979 RepID=UPI00399F5263